MALPHREWANLWVCGAFPCSQCFILHTFPLLQFVQKRETFYQDVCDDFYLSLTCPLLQARASFQQLPLRWWNMKPRIHQFSPVQGADFWRTAALWLGLGLGWFGMFWVEQNVASPCSCFKIIQNPFRNWHAFPTGSGPQHLRQAASPGAGLSNNCLTLIICRWFVGLGWNMLKLHLQSMNGIYDGIGVLMKTINMYQDAGCTAED